MTDPRAVGTNPATCDLALKEWAGVIHTLGAGRCILLLRKGGVAEGPDGFRFENGAFWLYPTFVHEAEQGLRDAVPAGAPRVEIQYFARVALVEYATSEDLLDALMDEHAWTAETIARRFRYRRPGLWVVALRVYRSPEATLIEPSIEQEGCKSWVTLDRPLSLDRLEPVLDDAVFSARLDRVKDVVVPANSIERKANRLC